MCSICFLWNLEVKLKSWSHVVNVDVSPLLRVSTVSLLDSIYNLPQKVNVKLRVVEGTSKS
jgi:hypothetical protein